MREEAARACAGGIDEASDAGIQNRRWWEDAIHWVSENWDTIVEVCKVVVAVLGIVVMIIGGPLAWVVLAAALVVLADTLYDYANGRASLWDVAFAALDCIPGMKGLTTLGGLAAGARALARGGLRGMAAGVRGLASRGRTMIADGMRSAFARPRDMIPSAGTDPVDLATGHMYLSATDVALPGTLPFTFTRRVQSGYFAGRWFGPSWSSTLDQRLEVDEQGVVFLAEDGMALAYPHPGEPGAAVLPEVGPRWPLTRQEDGGYALTNPLTGHTRHFRRPDEDGDCRILGISDRNGNRVDIDYDPDGAPTDIRHSGGYHLTLATAEGRVTALSLGDTVIRRYAYTEGNLTAVRNPAGQPLQFTYDHRLRVTTWTDTNDRHYAYTYDDRDRCVAEGGEAGHLALSLAYDGSHPDWPDARVTTLTTARGETTRHVIDDSHRVLAEIDACGGITRFAYDGGRHLLTARTDPLGHTTRFTHDPAGRPVVVEHPDGGTTRIEYGELGGPTLVSHPDGAVWRYEYDAQGNRTAVTDATGATARFTYEDGRLAAVTDALGATTRVSTDAAGLPLEITDPLGHRVTRRYDAFGRVSETTDPLGAVTRYRWTVDGRIARVVAPDGGERSWTYDGEGDCLRHTDANGATTEYEYTHFDVMTARTEPGGVRYEFRHDASLRLTGVTDPQGLAWEYEYDAAGRLVAERDFDGRRVTYERDAAGRVASRINAAGQTVTYRRDALGRITEKHADGEVTHYRYDGAGRPLLVTAPECEIRWERDPRGRAVAESVDGRTLSVSYDPAGRRTGRTTPTGAVAEYAYDAAGRRTSLTTSGHRVAFTHDAAGREVARQVGDSLLLTHGWDPAGRLIDQIVSVAVAPFQHRSYRYRPDGVPVHIDDRAGGGVGFDLDDAGRVTEVRAGNWVERYAYDPAGNQTHATWPGRRPDAQAQGERAYDGGRLTRAGGVRYEYDAAGRVVARRRTRLSRKPEVWRYEWSAEDRLTRVVTPDGTVWRYRYDPFGRRLAKQRLAADGSTVVEETRYTWDGPTLAEQTTTGPGLPHPVTLTWDHNGHQPVAQTERLIDTAGQEEIDSRFFAIVTDLVGVPTELVDEAGTVAWRARRTLWGITSWPSDSSAYTPLRFPGQYHDPETGLHYNVLRHYDPETSRYATQDPLGLAPAPNPVTYVRNPLAWADPLGLSPYPGGVLVPNNRPDDLSLELLDMEFSGLTPLTAGTQAFDDAVSGGGRFLWAVDSGSNLHIIQAQPGIHHPVLTGGGDVYGAGQVVFEPGRNLVSMIDNMTGHFTPTPEISANFLQQGVAAFENAGVRVRFDGITDYGGRSPA